MADAKNHAAQRDDKFDERWRVILPNQGGKIDLLKTNVTVKKRNTDLTFLMGVNMAVMDDQVKAWYMAKRNTILSGLQTSFTAAPTPSSSPTSSAAS